MRRFKKIIAVIMLVSVAAAFAAIRHPQSDKSLDNIEKKQEVKAK